MADCSVCANSTLLEAVNAALAEGKSVRTIADQLGVSKSVIGRHRANCLPLAQAALARREQALQVQVVPMVQTTAERLAPIDGLAVDLLRFVQQQIALGKAPNLSLVKTFLQSAEIALKAQALLESRQQPPQVSGLLEAGATVAYLREHYPEALAGLAAYLGAQL